jgi:hypothetical protein
MNAFLSGGERFRLFERDAQALRAHRWRARFTHFFAAKKIKKIKKKIGKKSKSYRVLSFLMASSHVPPSQKGTNNRHFASSCGQNSSHRSITFK